MRTFIRFLVGLTFPLGVIAAISRAITLPAYHAAPVSVQRGVVIGIPVVFFIVEWVVMTRVIPKRKPAQRPAYPYAAPGGRR